MNIVEYTLAGNDTLSKPVIEAILALAPGEIRGYYPLASELMEIAPVQYKTVTGLFRTLDMLGYIVISPPARGRFYEPGQGRFVTRTAKVANA